MDLYLASWHAVAKRFGNLSLIPPPHVLCSAYHLILKESKGAPTLRSGEALNKEFHSQVGKLHNKEQVLLLDSGGYGLLYEAGQARGAGVNSNKVHSRSRIARENTMALWTSDPNNLESYASIYYEELTHTEEVSHYAELDVEDLAGNQFVARWRDRLVHCGDHKRCLLVSHSTSPIGVAYECDRAIDEGWYGASFPNAPGRVLVETVERLRGAGLAAHGLGISEWESAIEAPYSSVDSNRWMAPVRWGRYDRWESAWKRWAPIPVMRGTKLWEDWEKAGKNPEKEMMMPLGPRFLGEVVGMQIKEFEKWRRDVEGATAS